MNKMTLFMDKCLAAWINTQPTRAKIRSFFSVIGNFFRGIGQWIYNLRSVFLAIPVVLAALRLAAFNRENLPDMVGIDLQESGQYAYLLERDTVIFWPLAITAACLLMMFCSRRIVYPWIISVFTLVIPILIYVTNVFPA